VTVLKNLWRTREPCVCVWNRSPWSSNFSSCHLHQKYCFVTILFSVYFRMFCLNMSSQQGGSCLKNSRYCLRSLSGLGIKLLTSILQFSMGHLKVASLGRTGFSPSDGQGFFGCDECNASMCSNKVCFVPYQLQKSTSQLTSSCKSGRS